MRQMNTYVPRRLAEVKPFKVKFYTNKIHLTCVYVCILGFGAAVELSPRRVRERELFL